MADEEDRATQLRRLLHLAEALALELGVADGETSSTSRISGSRCAATANASRTYMPLEYRFTGVSMKRSTPENSTISSKRCSISRAAHAQDRAVHEDVLATRELGMETGPHLEQGRRRAPRA